MSQKPWPHVRPEHSQFERPPREYGILPFWFLNGELEPEEMRRQLCEFRDKGMPGIILHGRYGLEMPYIGATYLDRIKFAVEEAAKLGLKTWIYDEMNWPSGTADQRVLQARPDLAQRRIECVNFAVRGPWFSYLTGADSRYLDFEKSKPIAAFAIGADGQVLDLTPNLSFENVIPWQAPVGNWRLMYIVEKEADYYIDALNPEATAEFLRQGYEPYRAAVGDSFTSEMLGFYTDEPAMHYHLSGADTPVVPWTKDMFRRFQERNGYNLRPRLPDLFFDVRPDSAQIRYDFYNTLTDFYSAAYYQQIHEWCQEHNVLFTGHLLYEEWLRKMIRAEGNVFKHYAHMDVIGVDHLYPFIGSRDRPDEHVALKVASSAAHHFGSERLLCESFGGIFMDATMQRMKWIADWQYVLGVNLLNPHGFHYTLEGPRKRDWPPSMFYQYPWWHFYGAFSDYMSRLSHMLSGGRHVAKVAMLWPINAMFATYTPQSSGPLAARTEGDFNALTDLLLRLHYDFDYLDEDVLAGAELLVEDERAMIAVRDERFELLIVPPMTHLKLSTLERLESFVAAGGRLLGAIFLPDRAFGPDGLVDIADRVQALFGVDPAATQRDYRDTLDIHATTTEHPGGGVASFLASYALQRQTPLRLQQELGAPGKAEHQGFTIEPAQDANRYFFALPGGERADITDEVNAERAEVAAVVDRALRGLIAPDVELDNPELFYLHRVKDGTDLYFVINPTFAPQSATMTIGGRAQPLLWEPSTGAETPILPARDAAGGTTFRLDLAPTGSAFVIAAAPTGVLSETRVLDTDMVIERIGDDELTGYTRSPAPYLVVGENETTQRIEVGTGDVAEPMTLDGAWEFQAEDQNALVIGQWLTITQAPGAPAESYAGLEADLQGWLPMVPGAWSFQLPAEPAGPYPLDVWHRATFEAEHVPPSLSLIVDGFAGASWQLWVNGAAVDATPRQSAFDSQMGAVEIGDLTREGTNVIALCLSVTNPTDGLLDLLKLTGDFSLAQRAGAQGGYAIAAPRTTLQPAAWTEQGYPFYSGRGLYRYHLDLPAAFAEQRVFLEPSMVDDALEIIVNGAGAGVRLWAPYAVEITDQLQPGANIVELRVANTLVNLLEATPRPSGLAGAPRLVAYRPVSIGLNVAESRQ